MMNIQKIVQRLSRDELLELALNLIRSDKRVQERALDFLERSGCLTATETAQKHNREYREKFAEAIGIIKEFNMYGGGPEEEEDIVYEHMETVLALLQDGYLPESAREEMIHALMEQYLEGNSGFEDAIWDWIGQIASTETHWRTIVDYLEPLGDRYYQSLILDIYRYKLGDTHTYEQRRAHQLRYGSDYAEYALFLEEKGDRDKALEIAEKGLKEGEGALDGLYAYLFKRYDEVGEKEKALQLLKQHFFHRPSHELYQQAIAYAPQNQKETVKQELYGWLESHPVHAFIKAKIDYTEGNNEALLHYVTKRLRAFDYSSLSTYERYLNKHYPLEMIAHYKRIVESLLAERKRSAYRRAIGFMKEIEHVYTNILKEPNKWSFYFQSFIVPHQQRLPAFLDEWKKHWD